MKDKHARVALDRLAEYFGLNIDLDYHMPQNISVYEKFSQNKKWAVHVHTLEKFENILRYDMNSHVLNQQNENKALLETLNLLRRDLDMLVKFLGLEIFDGREMREIKKK